MVCELKRKSLVLTNITSEEYISQRCFHTILPLSDKIKLLNNYLSCVGVYEWIFFYRFQMLDNSEDLQNLILYITILLHKAKMQYVQI